MLSRNDIGKLKSLSVDSLKEIGVTMTLTRIELVEFIVQRMEQTIKDEIAAIGDAIDAMTKQYGNDSRSYGTLGIPVNTPSLQKAIEFMNLNYDIVSFKAFAEYENTQIVTGELMGKDPHGVTQYVTVRIPVTADQQPEYIRQRRELFERRTRLRDELKKVCRHDFIDTMIANALAATPEGQAIQADVERLVEETIKGL